MNNSPVSFSFHESHDLRMQIIEGSPWFCLKDVCDILSVSVASPSRFQMDAIGVTKNVIPTDVGNQQLTFVNEPNLYRVIFVATNQKPNNSKIGYLMRFFRLSAKLVVITQYPPANH